MWCWRSFWPGQRFDDELTGYPEPESISRASRFCPVTASSSYSSNQDSQNAKIESPRSNPLAGAPEPDRGERIWF